MKQNEDKHLCEEKSKEERISAEMERISKYFEDVADNQRAIITPLLQNASFMKVTLEDLQEIVNREGVTEEYQNGANQRGVKQSATLQSYNALIKNYASVKKTLSSLLPYEAQKRYPSLLGWEPREKTEEELEQEEREEEARQERIRAEIAEAVEYQRRQREEREREKMRS